MASGGARPRSGPAPDPASQKSLSRSWVDLPADPDVFMLPAWPYPPALTGELKVWERVWTLPQARMWAKHRLELQVGAYVRALIASVDKEASAGMKQTVLKMEMELGITVDGMHRLGWRLAADADDAASADDIHDAARRTRTGNWLTGVKVRADPA